MGRGREGRGGEFILVFREQIFLFSFSLTLMTRTVLGQVTGAGHVCMLNGSVSS